MCFLFVEINNFLVLASLMGFRGGGDKNCLKDIRLSLCIVSVKNIGSAVKLKIQRIIIPVIRQFY